MQHPNFASTAAAIADHARRRPTAVAVMEDDRGVTYQEFAADLARCVRALAESGIRPRIMVGVSLRPDRYLSLLLLLACEVLQATIVALAGVERVEDDPVLSRCDMLVLGEAPVAGITKPCLNPPADFLKTLAARAVLPRYAAMLEVPPSPDRIARIFRTSGTTGRPKAIAISPAILQRIIIRHMDRIPPDILSRLRSLCLYNFGVRAQTTRAFGFLQHAGTLVFGKDEQAAAMLAGGAVNHVMLMVGDAERIISQVEPDRQRSDLLIELVGASAGPRLRRLIDDRLHARVTVRYSTNETNIIADIDENNVGTVAEGVSVRIVDASGQPQPPGQTGLIQVRTDTMADGYYDDPALTRSAFIDGWYHTNDVGCMPGPGRLVILGRADDMLNIGGIKVPPLPIEDRIRQLPGVADAAVLSVGNTNEVGVLVVAVELPQGQAPDRLREAITGIVAPYVRGFEFLPLPWFPRTETGKVRRPEIEAAYRRRSALVAADRPDGTG